MHETAEPQKTAVIAALQLPLVSDAEHASDVAELRRLLKTLGYDVVGVVSQRRAGPRAAAVLGPGKLLELAAYTGGTGVVPAYSANKGKGKGGDGDGDEDAGPEALDAAEEVDEADETDTVAAGDAGPLTHADVVVVDHEISPRQARNLEKALDAEVLDRTGVIVEIFHRHANTREARLQVEIARLDYVVPRLRAGVRGNERQRGKGAGESSLELDRRKVRDRIAELKGELVVIARDEAQRRSRRQQVPRVALVGYTNAGKSSLMRALTGSEVLVQDKLFATLGTTVRALHPEATPRVLVSDTVGFIKKLPHHLVASFRSTLDEALEAQLLLYVVDCSDPNFRSQLEITREVLADIGASETESRLLLNKVDKITPEELAVLRAELPDAIPLSAHDPADVAALYELVLGYFQRDHLETTLLIPYRRGQLVGQVHASMRVIDEQHDEHGTHLRVRAAAADIERVLAQLR
ncbi:MAG: GTPase HflX [Deltaproteobacteria bacterium HGW-Deltaproteobacteria-14]|jgi:GTP-binding protein HflX|nr:MAG: GTPase HflX [Deltaproteobacteria bacterium HGW-Deltaproteobacteria-14]